MIIRRTVRIVACHIGLTLAGEIQLKAEDFDDEVNIDDPWYKTIFDQTA